MFASGTTAGVTVAFGSLVVILPVGTVQSADILATKSIFVVAFAVSRLVGTLMSPIGPATMLGGVSWKPCTLAPALLTR